MRYLIWAILLLVALYMVGSAHSWLLGWLVYLIGLLALVALWVTSKPARVLAIRRTLSRAHAEIGQEVTVTVGVDMERISGPGWILTQDSLPEAVKAHSAYGHLSTTGAGDSPGFCYRVSGQRRGYFPIGPLQITAGDLFGLRQTRTTSEEQTFLTVFPRIVPVPTLRLPSNRPIGDAHSSKRIFEDPTRIVGTRDYAPGDTLSKIHWKSTARLGALVSKQCEPSTSIEVNILLNLCEGDYAARDTELELACTTAASVAASMLADKHEVGLQSNGYDQACGYPLDARHEGVQIKPDKGVQQSAAILSLLGRVKLAPSPTLADYLVRVHSRLPWTAGTLLITYWLTEEAALGLEALKRSGFELGVIIVGAGEYAEASCARVAALKLPLAVVQQEEQLANLEFRRPGRD
ncbi:MAG: DUF58 domain-containing protein [Armatimonadota bacterium]